MDFRICNTYGLYMTVLRITEAASLMGVSDDTVRRLVADGRLSAVHPVNGPMSIDGAELAQWLRERAKTPRLEGGVASSARNRLVGLVTEVRSDPVMSQVEMQAGPFRVVSLMSTEAVEELGLKPGVLATAVIKSTNVVIETRQI